MYFEGKDRVTRILEKCYFPHLRERKTSMIYCCFKLFMSFFSLIYAEKLKYYLLIFISVWIWISNTFWIWSIVSSVIYWGLCRIICTREGAAGIMRKCWKLWQKTMEYLNSFLHFLVKCVRLKDVVAEKPLNLCRRLNYILWK